MIEIFRWDDIFSDYSDSPEKKSFSLFNQQEMMKEKKTTRKKKLYAIVKCAVNYINTQTKNLELFFSLSFIYYIYI